MTGPSPLRIALFSEVYWPMVSGVGVTLLRLTDALRARGHDVRVYSATYPLPSDLPDRPEVHRSRASRFSSILTSSGHSRGFATSWMTLPAIRLTSCISQRSFHSGSLDSRRRGNSSCLSLPRLTPTTTSMQFATAYRGPSRRVGITSAGFTARLTACSAHPASIKSTCTVAA